MGSDARICEVDYPVLQVIAWEQGDVPSETQGFGSASSAAAQRLSRKITQAPANQLPMIEKIVDDLLDGLRRAG